MKTIFIKSKICVIPIDNRVVKTFAFLEKHFFLLFAKVNQNKPILSKTKKLFPSVRV
jgi:hypothetical protein